MTPEGWRDATYGTALIELEDRAGAATGLPVLSVTKTRGPMLASERFGKAMHGRDLGKYRVAPRNTVVADPMLLWDGSIGLQTVADAGLVSPDYRVYRPAEDVDPTFMGYVVRSPHMLPHYQGGARGTNVRRNRITRADFLRIPLKLPPMPEQRKIAAILCALDDAIAATQAVIEQLDSLQTAMMAELLTRGLRGRHTRFKDTELGEVPEAWSVARIEDVATVGNGATPSRQNAAYWEGGTVPWLPTGKVNDRHILNADQFITLRALEECSVRLLPVGTLLVAMIGQGKTRGMVARQGLEATINQNFAYIQLGPSVRSWFLFFVLNHRYEELRGSARGSNQGALNCAIIKQFLVPVPPPEEQERIEEAFLELEQRVRIEAAKRDALVELRAALTSVLLTGEVRVAATERVV